MKQKRCIQCGAVFIDESKGRPRKYCSRKCAKANADGIKSYEEIKRENEESRKREAKVIATGTLEEVNERARALHMTYGQYMEKYGNYGAGEQRGD